MSDSFTPYEQAMRERTERFIREVEALAAIMDALPAAGRPVGDVYRLAGEYVLDVVSLEVKAKRAS